MTTATILIPTHNGSGYLQENLTSLRTQIASEVNPKPIILVVDSGSDPLESYKTRLITESSGAVFISFSDNLGFDRNVLRAIGQIKSDYFWLMGDDDVAGQGCVRALQESIANRTFDVGIFPTHQGENPTLYEGRCETATRTVSLSYSPLYEEVIKNPLIGSALSSCVFRREAFEVFYPRICIGLDWIHHATILSIAANLQSSNLLRFTNNVFIRKNPKRWGKNFGAQYLAGLRQLEAAEKVGENDAAKRISASITRIRMQKNLLDVLTLGSSLTWDQRKLAFGFTRARFSKSFRFWLLDIPTTFFFCDFWPLTAPLRSLWRKN